MNAAKKATKPAKAGEQDGPAIALAFAVSINDAARMVGMSRSMFYKEFLTSRRVRPICGGLHMRLIDVQELRKAYDGYVIERRAEEGAA